MLSRILFNQNKQLISRSTNQFRSFCSTINNDVIVNTPLSKPLPGLILKI